MGKKYKDREAIIVDFSNRLRKERKRLKKTQKQLADDIGVDIKTIGNWEQGNTLPKKLDDALELCNLFECDIDYLFGRQKEKTKMATDVCEATGLKAEAVKYLIENKDNPAVIDLLSDFISHEKIQSITYYVRREGNLNWYISELKQHRLYERLKRIYESSTEKVFDTDDSIYNLERIEEVHSESAFAYEMREKILDDYFTKEELKYLGLSKEIGSLQVDRSLRDIWQVLTDEGQTQGDYWAISNLFLDIIKSHIQTKIEKTREARK